MRVTADQLTPFGVDGMLVHGIDTAFFMSNPKRVGIAVSGGGDSMALLHAAHRWSGLSGVPIEAVTVDHGLRPEAKDEAAMVAQVCADWDVPHSILHWDGAKATGNIAAAGRKARYDLMAKWAKRHKIGGVLLGHTKDDIAETFLMRLARKSGVDGLAMMDLRFERNGMTWARPFWQQSRADLRDYLRRHDVPWIDDPTNDDETHDRPKARKILAALAPLGIDSGVLKSVALNLTGARDALQHYTLDAARHIVRQEAGDVIVEQRPRPPMPQEVQRRLLVGALSYVGGKPYGPRWDAMIDLDAGLAVSEKHTLSGCVVTKEGSCLRIARELNAVEGPLDWPNRTQGLPWDGRWLVSEEAGCAASGDLQVRALGIAIKDVPDWRDLGLPRDSLMVTPAVFDGETLIAAPMAGLQNGFEARIVADFTSFLLSR